MADGSCEIQYETRIEPSCETLLMCIVAMLRDGVRSGGVLEILSDGSPAP